MKTFYTFKEDLKKSLSPLKDFGKSFAGQAEKFAKSDDAKKLMQQGMGLLFNKLDGVVEKGNKKYNEIKNKVNR